MLKDRLEAYGCDVEGTLQRCMNREELYISLLNEFPNDTSFSEIMEAYRSNNIEDLYKGVHSLKGVSGTLGFVSLYEICREMCEMFRTGKSKEALKLIDRMIEVYEDLCRIIGEG